MVAQIAAADLGFNVWRAVILDESALYRCVPVPAEATFSRDCCLVKRQHQTHRCQSAIARHRQQLRLRDEPPHCCRIELCSRRLDF